MKSVRISLLEIGAILMLMVSLFPLLHYGALDGVAVPRHYSGGVADAWGNRTMFLWIGVIALVGMACSSSVRSIRNSLICLTDHLMTGHR